MASNAFYETRKTHTHRTKLKVVQWWFGEHPSCPLENGPARLCRLAGLRIRSTKPSSFDSVYCVELSGSLKCGVVFAALAAAFRWLQQL
eukprot:147211-Amphidinium_carterae.1